VLHVLGRRNRISLGSVDDLAFLQVRQMDSLQLARNHNVATPANWAHGENVMIATVVSNKDAGDIFPKGFEVMDVPSGKGYLRITPQPNLE